LNYCPALLGVNGASNHLCINGLEFTNPVTEGKNLYQAHKGAGVYMGKEGKGGGDVERDSFCFP